MCEPVQFSTVLNRNGFRSLNCFVALKKKILLSLLCIVILRYPCCFVSKTGHRNWNQMQQILFCRNTYLQGWWDSWHWSFCYRLKSAKEWPRSALEPSSSLFLMTGISRGRFSLVGWHLRSFMSLMKFPSKISLHKILALIFQCKRLNPTPFPKRVLLNCYQ